MQNLIEKLEKTVRQINPRYDATYYDISAIRNTANNDFDLISLSFRFGYMQGQKALLAEQRKKARSVQ